MCKFCQDRMRKYGVLFAILFITLLLGACGKTDPQKVVYENGMVGLWYVKEPAFTEHNNTYYWVKDDGTIIMFVDDQQEGENRFYRGEGTWDFGDNRLESSDYYFDIWIIEDPITHPIIDGETSATRTYSDIFVLKENNSTLLKMKSEDFDAEEVWEMVDSGEKEVIKKIQEAPVFNNG